uniref:cell wall protein DAN4-like isoform X1 n=1 Tax=Ciona intestinalis TaxID=7719 RepID=UPI000EF46F49|nr:cell wall protein DAN4-like isoform X1 [Ciona intestinalis]|eukprot:XP_026694282.1 cell wall protein DAN4-like isoform X1 [Ciona intestinalis]
MTNTEECLVGEICQAVITNTTLGTGESLISISRSCSWQPLNGCLYKEKTKTCYVFCDEDFCNKMNILSDSGNSVAPSSERTTSFSTTLEQTTVSANLTASYTATTTTTTTTTAVTAPETYFLTADQLTTGSTNLTSTNSEPTTITTHLTRSNATTEASTNYEQTTESPLGATYKITTQSSNLPQSNTTGTTKVSSFESTTESTNLSESIQTTTMTVSPSSYQPTNNIISPAESFPATTSSTSYQSVPATTNISTVTFSSTVPNHILNNTVSSSSAFSIPVILTVLTTKESPLQDSTTAMIINGQYESEAAASENVPSTAVNRNMNTLTIDSTAFNSLLGSASIRTSNIETTTQSTNMFPTISQATSSQPIQAMVSSKHLQEIPDVSTSRDAQLGATHPETSITPNNIFTETATSPMQTETSDSYTTDQEIQDISNPTTTALNTFILTSEDGFSPTLTTVVGNEEATSTYERLSALPEVTTLTQSTIDQSTAVTSLLNTEQTTFITSRSNDKETSTMESQFTNETSTISAGEETTTESVSNTNSITHETFDGSTEQLVISSVSPTTGETLTTTPDTTMSNAVLTSSEDFQSQQTTGDLTSETSITPTTVSNISSTSNENTNSTAQSTEDYSEVPRGLHMPTTSVQVENNSLFTESTQTIATNAEGSADFQSQPETTTSRFSASSDAQEATTNNVPQTSSLGWNSPEGSGNTASGNGNTEETTSQSTSLYTKLFNSTESVTHYDITDKNTMRTVPSHMLRNMHQTTDSSSDKIRSNFVFIFAISLFSLIIL